MRSIIGWYSIHKEAANQLKVQPEKSHWHRHKNPIYGDNSPRRHPRMPCTALGETIALNSYLFKTEYNAGERGNYRNVFLRRWSIFIRRRRGSQRRLLGHRLNREGAAIQFVNIEPATRTWCQYQRYNTWWDNWIRWHLDHLSLFHYTNQFHLVLSLNNTHGAEAECVASVWSSAPILQYCASCRCCV